VIKVGKLFSFILVALLIIGSLAFIMLQSPLNPLASGKPNFDSCVYLYIGEHMADGVVPYLDVFEQKGPLIFFINYIGILIGGETGVWLMQILSMSVAMFFSFLIGKKYSNYIVSACATSIIFIFLQLFYETGNFTEEYALPYIFAAMYLFLLYFDGKEFSYSNIKLLLIGFTLGAVLMLRPNMIALWIVFCGFIVIRSVIKKEFKFLLKCVLLTVSGMAIAILPFIIYLGTNSALKSFIEQYWIFNLKYSSTSWGARLRAAIVFIKPMLSLVSIAFYIITTVFEKDEKKKLIYRLLFVYTLVNIGLVSMSGRVYLHYAMITVPVFIIPLSVIFYKGYDYIFIGDNIKSLFRVLLVIIVSIIISFGSIYDGLGVIKNVNNNSRSGPIEAGKIIKANTEEEDRITVLQYDCIIYLEADRLSSSKYIYQYPISDVSQDIKDEYMEHILEDQPKIIVSTNNINMETLMPEKQYSFIQENYTMIGTAKEYQIFKFKNSEDK
jgi:hypothetical protein